MKITASKKDDILKRKAQYEADFAAYNKRQEQYRRAYQQAEDELTTPIQDYLERKLSRYSALEFDVYVRRGWHDKGAEVTIECNEHNKFSEDSALSWSYKAFIGADGELERESSSWSGLSATTEAQMQSLRQTVAALELLNDLDWEGLINIKFPNYSDYYDETDKRPERENFEAELKLAELEELIGTNKIIKVKNWGESCPYRGDVWLHINRETPSMYMANIIPGWIIQALDEYDSYQTELDNYMSGKYGEYRIRKTSVNPVSPIEVKEV